MPLRVLRAALGQPASVMAITRDAAKRTVHQLRRLEGEVAEHCGAVMLPRIAHYQLTVTEK
jgi:hypothetical protein